VGRILPPREYTVSRRMKNKLPPSQSAVSGEKDKKTWPPECRNFGGGMVWWGKKKFFILGMNEGRGLWGGGEVNCNREIKTTRIPFKRKRNKILPLLKGERNRSLGKG